MQAPPDQRMTNTAKKMCHHKETQTKITNNGTTKKTTQRGAQTKDCKTHGTKANGKKIHGEIGEPKKSETLGLKKHITGITMKDISNGRPSKQGQEGQRDLTKTKKEEAKEKAKMANQHTERIPPSPMTHRRRMCISPTSPKWPQKNL